MLGISVLVLKLGAGHGRHLIPGPVKNSILPFIVTGNLFPDLLTCSCVRTRAPSSLCSQAPISCALASLHQGQPCTARSGNTEDHNFSVFEFLEEHRH